MALRRTLRWILICNAFLLSVYYLHARWTNSSPVIPLSEVRQSSYDWSQWMPYNPIPSTIPLPQDGPRKLPKVQARPIRQSRFEIAVQEKRRAFVKNILTKSWKTYKEFAWMRDELTPVSAGAKDTFGGWAATAVDALDTLWIMGMKAEFYETARAVVELDWAKTGTTSCNVFETTIRHLGGLLSAYDLSQEPTLLYKAIELGDMLYAAFDTPSHIPPFWLDYKKAKSGKLTTDDSQAAASVGSLSLEFTRLAQLTRDDKYYTVIARITNLLHYGQNLTSIPGLWPTSFDLKHKNFLTGHSYSLGALSDSMYEYVLKMHPMLGGAEPKYEQMWRTASEALIKHVLYRPMTPENLDILVSGTAKMYGRVELNSESDHLACFAGGMFALGGKLLNIPEHVEVGARLTKGCIWAYDAFQSGLMPEIFKTIPCDSQTGCTWDEETWKASIAKDVTYGYLPKGFVHARDPRYLLRPEALESVFVHYRITGDEEYRTAAWRMIQNIVKATETQYGNSAIDDVRSTDAVRLDSQESFWLAETLKYAYLIFSPSDVISLDKYVLNTEAHPLRRPRS